MPLSVGLDKKMSQVEKAVQIFLDRDNCAQAILATYGPEFGLDEESAINLSKLFGGGIVRQGSFCGAVTGALMVIGLKFGNIEKESDLNEKDAYDHAAEFLKEFKVNNGSYICRELIKFDLTTPENRELADKNEAFSNCSKYVRTAAEILEGMISI